MVELLSAIDDPRVSELGGKGYSLVVLMNNGFNVPNGLVITSEAFFSFLQKNGLIEEIEQLANEINEDNCGEKSRQVRDLIIEGCIPEEVVIQTKRNTEALHLRNVAIRSSAVSEDSLKSSFAGLHDTFLNVKAEPASILERVKKCFASLFNDRAIYYRLKKKLPLLEGMAVIVQEMIPAEVSGTTLTVHPDTGDSNMMVIEGAYGVGEGVVAGLVTPDRYIIDKCSAKIVSKTLGRKKVTVLVKPDEDGTTLENTSENKMSRFCLDDSSVESLAQVCIEIEKLFKIPQDVEWCLYRNRIWVLQSRSITSLQVVEK
jgi:pyruvate,water dikinase